MFTRRGCRGCGVLSVCGVQHRCENSQNRETRTKGWGRVEIIFIIVCIALIISFNVKGDAIHRENAGWVGTSGNPVVQVQHGCNGFMGCLMWIGLGLAILALAGGVSG